MLFYVEHYSFQSLIQNKYCYIKTSAMKNCIMQKSMIHFLAVEESRVLFVPFCFSFFVCLNKRSDFSLLSGTEIKEIQEAEQTAKQKHNIHQSKTLTSSTKVGSATFVLRTQADAKLMRDILPDYLFDHLIFHGK